MKRTLPALLAAALSVFLSTSGSRAADRTFADFEAADYGAWTVTGSAFGAGPAEGTLPGQMTVSGFRGKRLVNSFAGGDASTGTLTSPEFTIERRTIAFLIGGGGFAGKTCMNLLVDGRVARTATGPNTKPGGSEALEPAGWNVADLAGKKATIQIVDDATGGWGHINVDEIVFTDAKVTVELDHPARELAAERRYLHFPVKNGAKPRRVAVQVDGKPVREFDIELADASPDWWAPLDISAWKGKTLRIEADRLREDSTALSSIVQGDSLKDAEGLYLEPLRPRFHFSARRGWLNDPNGLVYHAGRFHLFFQHNPYGWSWGNLHWGHAVSRDMVHWNELGEALYPDRFGPMFSGSAVVDWKNTSGFGRDGKPPLVLIYTAAGSPTVQCIAFSTDEGRTFTKYDHNPVVPEFTPGNRDPKVFWHEPTKRWVMVLYVERDKVHTIQFLTSPDLKSWTLRSKVEPFFECPDFFELAVDGDPKDRKWVLTAASSEYMLGSFDGTTFTPESPKLPGHRGQGFYAAQTYSDIPPADGRRIQVGWLQAPSPGMPFNQAMSLPLELSLRKTADGPRLAWSPVKELTSLRAKSFRLARSSLEPGAKNPLSDLAFEPSEVRLAFDPGDAAEVALTLRGIPIVYDVPKGVLAVNGQHAPAPLRGGRQEIVVYLDRTTIEVFASDGLTYVPMSVIPAADRRGAELSVKGGTARIDSLEAHELNSAWKR